MDTGLSLSDFDDSRCTLLLQIPSMVIPPELAVLAETNGLSAKSEFHVTLIGTRTGNRMTSALAALDPAPRGRLLERLTRLLPAIEWRFSPRGLYYRAEREYAAPTEALAPERRESYLELVKVPGIGQLYHECNALLNVRLPLPPTHVTLFAKGTNPATAERGIGIETAEEFAAWCQPLALTD